VRVCVCARVRVMCECIYIYIYMCVRVCVCELTFLVPSVLHTICFVYMYREREIVRERHTERERDATVSCLLPTNCLL